MDKLEVGPLKRFFAWSKKEQSLNEKIDILISSSIIF
jgi:hypothetical protein